MATIEPVRLPDDDEALVALARPRGALPGASGLFRDDCWLRKVSGEPVLLLGGGCALLFEIAHPLVAEAVAEHSNFRGDPFGRLRRTLDAMSAIAFGDLETALAAARSVERAHQRVRGRLADDAGRYAAGTPYWGRDPELVLWVWATLADTALKMYERFVCAMTDAQREDYYADHGVVARMLGVPDAILPPSYADFRAYFDGMIESDAIAVTDTAREIAAAVLDPPVQLAGGRLVRSITAALLPARLRREFGLSWDESNAAKLDALARSVRSLRPPAPGSR